MNELTPRDRIEDAVRLRDHFGEPVQIAVELMKPRLDELHKRYIRNSPFICIAAAGSDGQPALSPRGDAPGFVKIIDDNTLVIPDRPGNNKLMTYEKLVQNPKVALLFFVPGVKETLRIEGEAKLVLDEEIRALGKVGSKLPPAAMVITVQRVFVHCGKALIRSDLWNPAKHAAPGAVPTLAEMGRDQSITPITLEEAQRQVDFLYKETLY